MCGFFIQDLLRLLFSTPSCNMRVSTNYRKDAKFAEAFRLFVGATLVANRPRSRLKSLLHFSLLFLLPLPSPLLPLKWQLQAAVLF